MENNQVNQIVNLILEDYKILKKNDNKVSEYNFNLSSDITCLDNFEIIKKRKNILKLNFVKIDEKDRKIRWQMIISYQNIYCKTNNK